MERAYEAVLIIIAVYTKSYVAVMCRWMSQIACVCLYVCNRCDIITIPPPPLSCLSLHCSNPRQSSSVCLQRTDVHFIGPTAVSRHWVSSDHHCSVHVRDKKLILW